MGRKGFGVVELLVGVAVLSIVGTMTYDAWDTFHFAKVASELGISEIPAVHGRAWESKLGGRVAIFDMEDGCWQVWVSQRRHDGPAMPTVGGKIVLSTENRDEALAKADELLPILAEGRQFFKAHNAYLLLPMERSMFFGTHYNWVRL